MLDIWGLIVFRVWVLDLNLYSFSWGEGIVFRHLWFSLPFSFLMSYSYSAGNVGMGGRFFWECCVFLVLMHAAVKARYWLLQFVILGNYVRWLFWPARGKVLFFIFVMFGGDLELLRGGW